MELNNEIILGLHQFFRIAKKSKTTKKILLKEIDKLKISFEKKSQEDKIFNQLSLLNENVPKYLQEDIYWKRYLRFYASIYKGFNIRRTDIWELENILEGLSDEEDHNINGISSFYFISGLISDIGSFERTYYPKKKSKKTI
jgi:hypothetical protein